jgi:hypothetical protein
LPCEKKDKHWVGVRVEDEDGKLVKPITVHMKLPDASELDVDMRTAALDGSGAFKTAVIYDPGNCEFSFPELYNLEWWPKGGKAGDATANQSVTVTDGDCMVSIAETLGFREYHSIWDRGENSEFKKKRTNPNQLSKDDTLKVPDQKDKVEKKAMDQVWIFVVKNKKPAKLRMILTDKDGKPLGNKAWELKAPIVDSGKTGNDGLVEVKELPGKHKSATVSVTIKDPVTPPAKPPAPTQPDPPPYPLTVIPDDFKDKTDPPDYDKHVVELELKIGSLESFDLKPGVLGRLHNLGFGCEIDSDDPHVTKAVKSYQKWFLKNDNGSGKPEDIQDDAKKRHDDP